ncbi:MAG: hypothetical protein VX733_05455 [Candidatus Latescibacterota bacterium]|nr:hypothetical protein [Candidatus Latescibacterota bacterium]
MQEPFVDFGWQGISLSVPEEWNLGRVDGDWKSGYARLDNAEMVRAEVEWREAPQRATRLPISEIVDRYLDKLESKARKAGLDFEIERKARFLSDKRWLEGTEYETFIWEADYRAHNLARICRDCGRIVLLRLLSRTDEPVATVRDLANRVFRSLQDHPTHPGGHSQWSLYGLNFYTLEDYKLSEQELKSGHIKLTFEAAGRGGHVCRVHRVSMAQTLLNKTDLATWYPTFFRKDLRDFNIEIREVEVRGHNGLLVSGAPKGRWRQILRPLPLVNPRPRRHLTTAVWHCPESNRICVVDHLYKKRDDEGSVVAAMSQDYVCHAQEAASDPRSDAKLEAGTQRAAEVGED